MKNNKLFAKLNFLVWGPSLDLDKVEVKVYFIYQKTYIIKKSLFINIIKHKDEDYYLEEAKKIISKMIEDGSLKKYSDEYAKKERRKKCLLFALPLVSACAIAGIAVGCYYGLQAKEVEVVFCPTSENHLGHWIDNNGTETRTVKVQSGKIIDKSKIPEVSADAVGAEFSGWYKEGTDTLFNLSNTVVTADMVLVAHYSGGALILKNLPTMMI